MKYMVQIVEELVKHVVVEAESIAEAEDKVSQAHYDGKIVLDYQDYNGANFECLREADENDVSDYIDVEDL